MLHLSVVFAEAYPARSHAQAHIASLAKEDGFFSCILAFDNGVVAVLAPVLLPPSSELQEAMEDMMLVGALGRLGPGAMQLERWVEGVCHTLSA